MREVLADLRPNSEKFQPPTSPQLFGDDPALQSAGQVTRAWRARHSLVRAGIDLDSWTMAGESSSAPVMKELSRGMKTRLDRTPALRSRDRDLTRKRLARALYDEGRAGSASARGWTGSPLPRAVRGAGAAHAAGAGDSAAGAGIKELIAVCAWSTGWTLC